MNNERLFQEGIKLHQDLLAICEQEEKCIIANDVPHLMQLVEQKEQQIARIRDWEKTCRKLLAAKLSTSPEKLGELKELVKRVQVKNAQLCHLLQTSLEYIYAQLDVLSGKESLVTYSSRGEESFNERSIFNRKV